MTLYVDAQLPEALAAALRTWGYDAAHVRAVLPPDCADDAIWHHAGCTSGNIIITCDADFVALAQRGVGEPRVIWVRIGNCSNARLIAIFEARIASLLRDLGSRRLVTLR